MTLNVHTTHDCLPKLFNGSMAVVFGSWPSIPWHTVEIAFANLYHLSKTLYVRGW